jgi:hypothetical protein
MKKKYMLELPEGFYGDIKLNVINGKVQFINFENKNKVGSRKINITQKEISFEEVEECPNSN